MKPVNVQNVTKSYGAVNALDDISFEVREGELFGLIGPDGAGKTTLFRILTTLLRPDAGRSQVLGMDVIEQYRQIRPLLGYMPGRFALYQDLSVEENLTFFASVFGTTVEENYQLVKPIYRQLEPFRDRCTGALSGGMKQKLALCCALIHKPKLLLLDEPTTGVDAVSRKEFWEMLHRLRAEGITILASTPYMDEAAQCDRIALIQDGTILSVETPQAITSHFDKPLCAVSAPNKFRLIQALRSYEHAESVQPFGEFVHYTDRRDEPELHELRSYLGECKIGEVRVEIIEPGIEDTFMRLMEMEGPDG